MAVGILALLAAGGLFAFVVHLAGVQQRQLGVRLAAPDEREAIDTLIREQEHALDVLYEIGHRRKPRAEFHP